MATYQSYLNSYFNFLNRYKNNFKNPYTYSLGNPSADTVNNIVKGLLWRPETEATEEDRSFLNRVFDTLSTPNYMIAGAVQGAIRDDKSVLGGMWEGLKAGNPFGKGNPKGEVTFSDVLGDLGWKPDGTIGKIARGTTGFALDVLLDPTTYLTGGLSALVKGTGKVGKAAESVAKLSEDIARAKRFNTRVDELLAKNVQLPLAVRVAERSFDKPIDTFDLVDKLTPEHAQELIKMQNYRSGVPLSEAELLDGATNFADKYNKLLGLRENGNITFGIGNIPFAPKSWRNKVINLGSDKYLRELGDTLGLSKAYAGLRNFIYGSQIGKMFSTKHPLYKFAHENPTALWEALEFTDMTKGMKMDKIKEEKLIRDRFKSLANLSPAEQKEVLDLLQDKTIWKPIKEKINFAQSELAKTVRDLLAKRKAKSEEEFNDLLKQKEFFEQAKALSDKNIALTSDELEHLKSSYREQLAKFDAHSLKDEEQYKTLIDELQKQIDELDSKYNPKGEVDALFELYDRALKQREENQKFHERLNMLHDYKAKNNRGELNNLIDTELGSTRANEKWIEINPGEYEDPEALARAIRKKNNELIDKEIFEMRGKAPGRSESLLLEEALSNYIFGESGKLIKLRDSNIDDLMEKIKEGYDPKSLRDYVKSNAERFAPHMSDVWNFIAQELHYKDWNKDGFKYPMAMIAGLTEKEADEFGTAEVERIANRKYEEGKMKPAHQEMYLRLLQKKFLRQQMIYELSRMTPEAFQRYRTAIANERLIKDFYETEDGHLSLKRNEFIDDDSSIEKSFEKPNTKYYRPGTSAFDWDYEIRDENGDVKFVDVSWTPKPKSDGFIALDTSMRHEVWNDMVAFNLIPKNFFDFASRSKQNPFTDYMSKLMGHLEDVLRHTFDKEYDELSEGAKKLALRTAMQLTLNNAERADVRLAKAMEKRARQLLKLEKIKAIEKEVTIGSEIRFKKDGEIYRGIVQKTGRDLDDIPQYTVEIPTSGEIIDGVRASHILKVKNNKEAFTPTELLMKSDLAKEDFASKLELMQQLQHTQDAFSTFRKTLQHNRNTLKQFYESRIQHYESTLKSLEANRQELMKTFTDADDVRLNTLLERIKRDEERITNDDALEQYVRAHQDVFGDIDALPTEKPNAGRIWLDEKASSEKIAETVRALRHEFDRIGIEEIKIGRLSEEQFNGMLQRYVPHVLTPEGKDYFASLDEVQEHGKSVTHDLGFGIKYNPFSQHRTIHGKTIEEINKHFRDALKGKNLFSENIADIYLARAMKHSELMYDDKYMRTMLEKFGKDIQLVNNEPVIENGYKAVANYGMLRELMSNIASLNLSTFISESVRAYIKANRNEWKEMARKNGSNFQKFFDYQVDTYIKNNFNDKAIKETYDNFYRNAIHDSMLSESIFEGDGLPLIELEAKHIKAVHIAFSDALNNHLESLNKSIESALNYGDLKRIDELQKRKDELKNIPRPQIKQVNETIAQMANQALKLQRAKDQKRFLQLYDKFLHFMKLNQTTVVPSFHVRNKLSNVFLNWLGVGRDALNMDYQLASTFVAKVQGDADKIQKKIENSSFWRNRLRPITIDKPHPTLLEAVSLNNGQLHWNDLYELAKAYDVIDEGFFAKDIGASAMMKGKFKKLRYTTKDGKRINLDPTDTENFILYKKGMDVGSTIENSDRLLHFMSMLKQGKSIREAAESTKTYLFDYSDLTAFEQSVMKRILPYYTWLRKNARLQVSQLIEQPQKYQLIAKLMNGINSMNGDDEIQNIGSISPYAQDWLQLPFTHTNEFGRKEPIIMNPNMPFMDFNRIPDPTRPVDSALNLASQTSPQIKVPAELLSNRSFFFNDKLIKGDDKAKDIAEYLLNQLALGNVATGIADKRGIDLVLHLINSSTGFKLQAYDKDLAYAMAHPKAKETDEEKIARLQAIMRYLNSQLYNSNTQ